MEVTYHYEGKNGTRLEYTYHQIMQTLTLKDSREPGIVFDCTMGFPDDLNLTTDEWVWLSSTHYEIRKMQKITRIVEGSYV